MKKNLKILLIVIASILILITIAIASMPLFFPSEKMRSILVTELTSLTGRQVAVNKLKFNVFKGIELDSMTIKERDSQADFIRDDTVLLKYNLLALLIGKLIIYKFELISPYIEIIKDKNGVFNFQDIIDKNKKPAVGAKSVSAKKSKSGKKQKQQPTPIPQPVPQPAGNGAGETGLLKNIIITSIGVK